MTHDSSSQKEPSQAVLQFLMDEMRLRFPLVQDRHPALVPIRCLPNGSVLIDGNVFVDVWTRTGQWIMSSATSAKEVTTLEEIVKDPAKRSQMLEFFARNIRRR
ncbi:hypothetical protein A4R35_00520 [Thermogemmatispora tikiterensis]|uniref:Uncharacterized protein n=1 Tax=Thermogemmatispora tikiterensis TaxID=1825093 RepID=A0A328VFA3_9CHLR|nr:hypothetical protein A4R35_00520 [Thermogemmatispora tikiterensis]